MRDSVGCRKNGSARHSKRGAVKPLFSPLILTRQEAHSAFLCHSTIERQQGKPRFGAMQKLFRTSSGSRDHRFIVSWQRGGSKRLPYSMTGQAVANACFIFHHWKRISKARHRAAWKEGRAHETVPTSQAETSATHRNDDSARTCPSRKDSR